MSWMLAFSSFTSSLNTSVVDSGMKSILSETEKGSKSSLARRESTIKGDASTTRIKRPLIQFGFQLLGGDLERVDLCIAEPG